MEMRGLPDRRKKRFHDKISVALEKSEWDVVEEMRKNGKDVSEYLRPFIKRALSALKKTG